MWAPKSLQEVTAAILKDACSSEKNYDQPKQHIKKQILLTKFHVVKAMVFPVVMYECDSQTMKKAEH